MADPQRIQLSRKKGFDLQAHSMLVNGLPAVNVDHTTRFGNPVSCSRPYGCPHCPEFEWECWEEDDGTISPYRCCVAAFRHYCETGLSSEPTRTGYLGIALDAISGYPRRRKLIEGLPALRGKNLACSCPLDQPCHADVLLELANREQENG